MKPNKCQDCGSKKTYLIQDQKGEYVHCSKCHKDGDFFFTDHGLNRNMAVENWNFVPTAPQNFDDENTSPVAEYKRDIVPQKGREKYGLFDIAK